MTRLCCTRGTCIREAALKGTPQVCFITSAERNRLIYMQFSFFGLTCLQLWSMQHLSSTVSSRHDLARDPILFSSNMYPPLDWVSKKSIFKRLLNFMTIKSKAKMIYWGLIFLLKTFPCTPPLLISRHFRMSLGRCSWVLF